MQFLWKRFLSKFLTVLFLCGLSLPFGEVVFAAQSTVRWVDEAKNEVGFKIERKQGTSGTYSQIMTAEANTTSYVDADLSPSTTYCYRVRAYTLAGNSAYASEVCVTTPAQQYRLSASLVGSGTLTSSSSEINCPTDCGQDYVAGTKVTLTPKPLTGWKFSSWGGKCAGQGSICVLTMSDTKNVTVNFSR
jgi:hypothetical protein